MLKEEYEEHEDVKLRVLSHATKEYHMNQFKAVCERSGNLRHLVHYVDPDESEEELAARVGEHECPNVKVVNITARVILNTQLPDLKPIANEIKNSVYNEKQVNP